MMLNWIRLWSGPWTLVWKNASEMNETVFNPDNSPAADMLTCDRPGVQYCVSFSSKISAYVNLLPATGEAPSNCIRNSPRVFFLISWYGRWGVGGANDEDEEWQKKNGSHLKSIDASLCGFRGTIELVWTKCHFGVSDQIDQNQFQHSKRGQNSKRVHVRSDVIIISTGRQFNCVTVVVMSHNIEKSKLELYMNPVLNYNNLSFRSCVRRWW